MSKGTEMQQYGTLIYFALLAALFYFLFIRPQAQRQRQQAQLLASLAPGDRVVTAGGIYGTIRAITGDVVQLEIAEGVVVDIARPAVGKRIDVTGPSETTTESDEIVAGGMSDERSSGIGE